MENWRSRPTCVEALKGKAITRVAAGNGFSVFSSDNGIVMTCGDGSFGALGHGDWNSSARPMLIEQLLSVDVVGVGAGTEHVVVVGGQGDVYAWGRGQGDFDIIISFFQSFLTTCPCSHPFLKVGDLVLELRKMCAPQRR